MTTTKYDQDVKDAIKAGVDKLADAVKVTLGPKGSNVIIGRTNGEDPQVTKDGVTVAKEFELEDPFENMGATVVKRVSEKSNDLAGDGTTTATVLTQAILSEGLKLVSAGYNPLDIKKGIDKATEVIVAGLNSSAIPISYDSPMVEQIATVSANNDPEVGKIVAEAFLKVGEDGAVSVEPGAGFETVLHRVDGLQFDRGLLSTYFSASPTEASCTLKNPAILVVEGKLNTTEQVMAVLEPLIRQGKGLVIIAEDITGDALSTLVLNKLRGGHQIAAVKAPGFGEWRKDLTKDIAAIVGAEVVPSDMVHEIEEQYFGQLLGTASTVKIEQLSTVIMGGLRNKEKVDERINEIEAKLSTKITKFEEEKLKERKAKLGGGVAIIEVGAKSEVEMKELKDRYDDAKEAVISALEEGVVIGGGCALLKARSESIILPNDNKDYEAGIDILFKAIEAPFRTICENAEVSADVKLASVLKHGGNYGYNAKTNEFDDMMVKGILDPKKVTRIALESAASVAGTLLTTKCALMTT